ncbi:MAG: ABC transporter substrate-binding protein [Victivallaceae bacterium]
MKSAPNELEEFFNVHKATYNQTLIKLRLPFAIPHIFSGLKIAAAGAGFGAIASEWVAGTSGLGILILETRRNYDLEMTFGALFTLSVLTISFYSLILYLEKVFFRAFRITKSEKINSNRKSHPKCVLTGLTLTLVLVGIWICVKQNKSEKISKVGLRKTELLLDWLPNVNHIPLYVGKEKKFFENRNIDLSIRKCIDGGNTLSHLLFQKADLIIQSTTGTVKAYLKGSPVQIIGQLIELPLSGLIYRKSDVKINDISELNGKIFGLYFNSQDPSVFLNNLKKHGVVPKQVKNVSADLISPMVLKKIDVLYGAFWNIEGIKLESLGLKLKIFSPSSYGIPDAPQMIIVAKQKTVFSEKHFVSSFRKALNESINFCIHNPEESLQIFFKYAPQNKKIQKNMALQWDKTLPLLAKTQDKIDDRMLFEISDWLTKNNSLKGFSNERSQIDLESF